MGQSPTEKINQYSLLAENIIGSEIIKLAAEVNAKIKNGQPIKNMTIGDFDPKQFPIPTVFLNEIVAAYQAQHTNYPPADGILDLRQAVGKLLEKKAKMSYAQDELLIAGGARPVIYAVYRAIVDPQDKVLFAVPSWNNNHYSYLNSAQAVVLETSADSNFMPTAADIRPHVEELTLIALCSPQNPTGTVFTKEGLSEICELVLAENKRREGIQKPLYVMYDQIYWELTMDGVTHYNPVELFPEMKPYTVYVDGLSKSLSATGVRVGWAAGPKGLIGKMKSILSHVGAWAPKAEQIAAGKFIANEEAYEQFLVEQRERIAVRMNGLYDGFAAMQEEGLPIRVIQPQGAIYLTVQFDLKGYKKPNGEVISTTEEITAYILDAANLAIVPFYAFGAPKDSTWYRLSIGTCSVEDIAVINANVRQALEQLKK